MEPIIVKTETLVAKLKSHPNPAYHAGCLGPYISDGLREKYLSLYEAFLLQAEALNFTRMSYTQPAWSSNVHISILLEILNMKMMSILFQNERGAELWTEYGIDAYKRNQEIRPHYVLDEYLTYLKAENNPIYLQRLLKIRQQKRKSFNKGPYHDEKFPYSECNFEDLLLRNKRFSDKEKQVSEVVENLLVELYFLQEN